MKNEKLKCSGFSLVELLVVVAVVAVLSVSSVVGFGYLGDILKAREVTGFISDNIRQEELKVLRGDFEKVVIHFLPDYLVIEEWPEDIDLGLAFDPCVDGYQLDYIDFDGSANLTKRDEDGAVLAIENVTEVDIGECIQFDESEDIEWNYQLTKGNDYSPIIRFIHFNLHRESREQNPISITNDKIDSSDYETVLDSGGSSQIEIIAPYSKKYIYYNDAVTAIVRITAKDENENSEATLTLQ